MLLYTCRSEVLQSTDMDSPSHGFLDKSETERRENQRGAMYSTVTAYALAGGSHVWAPPPTFEALTVHRASSRPLHIPSPLHHHFTRKTLLLKASSQELLDLLSPIYDGLFLFMSIFFAPSKFPRYHYPFYQHVQIDAISRFHHIYMHNLSFGRNPI